MSGNNYPKALRVRTVEEDMLEIIRVHVTARAEITFVEPGVKKRQAGNELEVYVLILNIDGILIDVIGVHEEEHLLPLDGAQKTFPVGIEIPGVNVVASLQVAERLRGG